MAYVPITLDQLLAWRDRLIEARLSGIQEVRDAFRSEVRYKSDAEMRTALADVNEQIAAYGVRPPNTLRFHTTKGLQHR